MILALFFTRNISLAQWVEQGLFDREKLLYEAYLEKGHMQAIFWITYGAGDGDTALALRREGRLAAGISILPMPGVFTGRIGRLLYSLLIPFIHFRQLKNADIFKTNQMDGSWSALLSKMVFGKPLLLRTGYTASLFMGKSGLLRRSSMMVLERLGYMISDLGEVASEGDREYLAQKIGVNRRKLAILRNYVDTKLFSPYGNGKAPDAAVFVGRLSEQKNLFNTLIAVRDAGLRLDIYGQGELEPQLTSFAEEVGAPVRFLGVVANRDLPGILNRYGYYILFSLYEGMPKALIEAMACGLVCVGTQVQGIVELIQDGETGFLARGTDAASLTEALRRARQNGGSIVGRRAESKIREAFSLESVVAAEMRNIQSILANRLAKEAPASR